MEDFYGGVSRDGRTSSTTSTSTAAISMLFEWLLEEFGTFLRKLLCLLLASTLLCALTSESKPGKFIMQGHASGVFLLPTNAQDCLVQRSKIMSGANGSSLFLIRKFSKFHLQSAVDGRDGHELFDSCRVEIWTSKIEFMTSSIETIAGALVSAIAAKVVDEVLAVLGKIRATANKFSQHIISTNGGEIVFVPESKEFSAPRTADQRMLPNICH